MNQSEKLLQAHFESNFQEAGLTIDQDSLNALARSIQLEEGESNEEDEYRSVDIHQDTDDKVTAKQWKLFNTIKINFRDIFGLGVDAMPIMIMGTQPQWLLAFAVLKLIYKYISNPGLTVEFNEIDAKILLAIYKLNKKEVERDEIKVVYEKEFVEALSVERLGKAISFFRKQYILKHQYDEVYKVTESMTYERDY